MDEHLAHLRLFSVKRRGRSGGSSVMDDPLGLLDDDGFALFSLDMLQHILVIRRVIGHVFVGIGYKKPLFDEG